MKKWAVILFLLFTVSVARAENVSIEVLLSSDSTIYEEALAGLQSSLQYPVNIRYLDVLLNEEPDPASYFRQIDANETPVYITFGVSATRLAKENLRKTPIIFSMINSPRILGLSQTNLCGVSMDISLRYFLDTLKLIKPDARRVHAFYSSEQGRFIAEEGQYVDFQYGLYFTSSRMNRSGLEGALESLKSEVDAIYMVPDPLYDRATFTELSEFARQNEIILMSPFPALVRLGATFGFSPDYTNVGLNTGEMANRIIQGSDCKTELVSLPGQPTFSLNADYAASQNVLLPETVIDRARLAGLSRVGVNLFRENKFKSSRAVFESILKRDPGNLVAKYYRSLVIERLTADRTSVFFTRASQYEKQGNFQAARAQYLAVIQLNPDDRRAREGLAKTSQMYSQHETQRAIALTSNNDVFGAMRAYQLAIQVWPQNQVAAAGLAGLRNQQAVNIPQYMNEAQNLYSQRYYDQAISIFNNVLLIQPGHQEAGEYVRLSHEKKTAIERLLKDRQ